MATVPSTSGPNDLKRRRAGAQEEHESEAHEYASDHRACFVAILAANAPAQTASHGGKEYGALSGRLGGS